MDWTAVVPLKQSEAAKSRLDPVLPVGARTDLVEAMARHVLGVLGQVSQIGRVVVLTASRPPWWSGNWAADGGASLNDALDAWLSAHTQGPVLVVHADLPYLADVDVTTLLAVATESGAAMATDIHGTGTNALALADARDFQFRFGPGSRAAHAAAGVPICIVRPGLAQDIDTPADLAALIDAGGYSI
jgi:2-phospho-L-lactate/phosphoenolpyruvate guanylyltransferase